MRRMTLEQNETLRLKGWSYFRSSSRDHLVPLTSAPARLQRIQIRDAMPVNGVGVGQESINLDVRAQINDDRQRAALKVFELARDNPTGETQACEYMVMNFVANPGPAGNRVEELFLVGTAPFSGFITELTFRENNNAVGPSLIALRTGSGGSFFGQGNSVITAVGTTTDNADYAYVQEGREPFATRRSRVPVLAGEQVFISLITLDTRAAFSNRISVMVTYESVEGAPIGARALVSALAANRSQAAEATRAVYLADAQLRVEQEKTKRAVQVEALRLEGIRANANARQANGTALNNPFTNLNADAIAKALLANRQPVVVPKPRPVVQPAQPPEGAGKTFVSAWNPSFGYIGYLIPNPPVGGKVNVFDNKYSVFDITGKLVAQGMVEPIATDAQIPAGAKLSRSLGVKLSPDIPASAFVPGQGFVEV